MFSRRIDAAIKIQEYQKVCEDIERDSALSILEREFLFVSLQRKIDVLYYEKEKIHIEKEAEELRKENAKLQYQIQNLKNKRAEKELAFAKYALYQSLDDSYVMKPYSINPEKISIQFIPEKKADKFDNIAGIESEIYKVGRDMDRINLYVDMQGGSRTSGYVRNTVLSILNNQETSQIQIGKIVATEFNPRKSWVSQMVDETDRYRIHDLVSGMNAFIRYGKADMLVKYCEDTGEDEDSPIKKLVLVMKKVDVNYLQLVDWCQRKGLTQQALTIIEDKMPEIVSKSIQEYVEKFRYLMGKK